MKKTTQIIWGIAIIALGVIFAGNALHLFDINIFFKGWWTLFIIVPSIINLFTEDHKVTSLIFICAGVILLLAAQEVFDYDVAWKVILAIVLVAIGFSIIFQNAFRGKLDKKTEEKIKKLEDELDSLDAQTAVFSGSDRAYKKEKFSGSTLVAIFGGVELDLRDAVIEKDAVIKAFCLFGGIDIKVPSDVEVKVKSGFIFGGISDDRKKSVKSSKRILYIDAAGGFGGVSVNDESE